MAEAASLYATSYFPVRRLFPASTGGAGHWRVTRAGAQDRRFGAVVCSASSQQKTEPEGEEETRRPRSDRMRPRAERALDPSVLMKKHHVKRPSDLCAADVSDRGLNTAQCEDFQQFSCLAYINASENLLHLEDFRTFPALRELDLSMNGIHRITVLPGEFPQLEVLDLSYNSLSPEDIPQLGALPRLRMLYLTGNGLRRLPPDLSAPPVRNAEMPMFPRLEVFMLDDNFLSHPSVFGSLADLQGLRLLNLDNNALSAVPFLSGAARSPPGRRTGDDEGRGHRNQETIEEVEQNQVEDGVDYVVLRSTEDPDRTEVIFSSPRAPLTAQRPPKPVSVAVQPPSLPSPPLPNLRTLSLADNKISHEDDVLPVALFPALQELIINGNPLTALRKGDPPLLHSFLQQRLGIKVICKKSPGFHKPHLIIPRKEKRKVTGHVPKIPKHPLMLESLLSPSLTPPNPESDVTASMMSSSPLPPIRTSSEKSTDTTPGRSMEEERSDPGVEPVFMTQVDHIHVPSPGSAPEERDTAADKKTEALKIPDKFRGYEELYDVTPDPAFIEPVGIQNTVRALEHALRHLLVYRDCRPRLEGVQKPHLPRESKFAAVGRRPRESKQDVAVEVLSGMKARRRQLLEAPLDSALKRERSSNEYKEAKLLLKELRQKYQSFHEEAERRASEVGADLRDSARQLLLAQRQAGDAHRRATHGKIGRSGGSAAPEDSQPRKIPKSIILEIT